MEMFKTLKNQWLSPPKPTFTENEISSQGGRVFIVTGANSGIGFELCKILYGTGAKVYMACRSKERADSAIKLIQESDPKPKNPATLVFLPFDLNDLESVKAAAASFQQQESKLDVLWNNAGCGPHRVRLGQRTVQGHEPMVGMHLIATLLFCQLLRPQLRAAVTSSRPSVVRVIWLSSIAMEDTPPNGIEFEHLENGKGLDYNYGASKVGSWFLGREMAHRWSEDGILTVTLNPGNVRGNSYENMPWASMLFIRPLLHQTRFGAYTELYAGLSDEINMQNNGDYIIPWGRIQPDEAAYRQDIISAMKPEEQGGLGYTKKLWEWCEEQFKTYI